MEPMRTIRELLKSNLSHLRKDRGWDQAELAHQAGISSQMVQKIEQGKTNPSLEKFDQISNALEIQPAQLFLDPTRALHEGGLTIPIQHLDHPTNEDLTALGGAFALASPGKRALTLLLLTGADSYYRRALAIPHTAQIARVLKKWLLSS